MYVIGDIGNTEVKICVYSTNKKLVKKIILKSNLININYLKKNKLYLDAVCTKNPKLWRTLLNEKWNEINKKEYFKKV